MESIPPDDAEEWSDEQWLDWLNDTDPAAIGEPPARPPAARPRSTGSQMLYAAMFGLHEVIYGTQEEVTVLEEAGGEPDEPRGLEVHVEPDSPETSTVVVRPWLIEGHDR